MKPSHMLALIVGVLLLLLTYLLVQGATPDQIQHERTLEALRRLILNDAALRRDVLQARAGLLRNYDPLVQSIDNMRGAADALRMSRVLAGTALRSPVDEISTAVGEQEVAADTFKSTNAVLQNSLSYFSRATHWLSATADQRPDVMTAAEGMLATAMLRFVSDPRPEAAASVTAALDRLAGLPSVDAERENAQALVVHGRIIVATLPAVDASVRQLLGAETSERARLLQDAYLTLHGQTATRAGFFRILLYVASLLLLAYLSFVFLQLQANARDLRSRVEFEQLIASISTNFLNLPRDQTGAGIRSGLARLAEHMDVDCARIVVYGDDETGSQNAYVWHRGDLQTPACSVDDIRTVAIHWSLQGYERQGCICVPQVQHLPASTEKQQLLKCDIRSWLCIPMWLSGKRIGILTLDTVSAERRWPDDDIALLRTVGEILATALERERAEAEREALDTQLRHAQRLEAIGTLAGGIAHEFNNILGAVLGYSEMARDALEADSRPHHHVQQVMKAAQRAQGVVDQILAFSRRSEREHRPAYAQGIVEDAIDLLAVSLPASLTIRRQFEARDAAILCDSNQVQQVVMNLCTNAAQAMDGRGELLVSVDAIDTPGALTLSHGILDAGHYVRIAVSDSGSGIETAHMERIFEPFFTTKAVGSGTGLGLPTVHGIVTQHGGALNVRSRLGQGSTFETYFPGTEERVPETPAAAAPVPQGCGETVMLVDDEASLVNLGEELLAALGYEPVGFDKSTAALAAFSANPQRFDLVIADEIMPGMTGTELAAEMHRARPDLAVVLMTGYSGPIRADRLRASGIREVLKKPLLSADIAHCLARHLSRATAVRPLTGTGHRP